MTPNLRFSIKYSHFLHQIRAITGGKKEKEKDQQDNTPAYHTEQNEAVNTRMTQHAVILKRQTDRQLLLFLPYDEVFPFHSLLSPPVLHIIFLFNSTFSRSCNQFFTYSNELLLFIIFSHWLLILRTTLLSSPLPFFSRSVSIHPIPN